MDDQISMLRELFQARFDTLDAKLVSISATFERQIARQDETIERIVDRVPHPEAIKQLMERIAKLESQSVHPNEIKRLIERVAKLEAQIESGRSQLSELHFKVKVTWAVGGAIVTAILAILIAVIQHWIGV
jgi:uncharacterized coiled-coil protein SlyX